MAKLLDATLRRAYELRRAKMDYDEIADVLDCEKNSAQQYVSLGRRARGLTCQTITLSEAMLDRACAAADARGIAVEFWLGEMIDRELSRVHPDDAR